MESAQSQADKPAFVKYPKISALADLAGAIPLPPETVVTVFEKIDGGNCQVRRHNGQVLPGSRGHYIAKMHTEALDWFRKFCKWTYPNASLYNLPEDIVMFGEWAGNHTINYGPEFNDKFVFLDAFDLKSKRFMPYSDAVAHVCGAKVQGVTFLEPLVEDKAKNINIEKLVMEPSRNYTGPKEGIVIKAYGESPQSFFKAYHPDFAESRDEKLGNADHLTSVRFRKAFHGLCEEMCSTTIPFDRLVETVALNVIDEHSSTYSQADVRSRLNDYLSAGKLEDIKLRLTFDTEHNK